MNEKIDMKLSELLQGIGTMAVQGSMDSTIRSITTDSRQVKEGTLFIAVRGTRQDGHAFIEKAVEAGAAAVLCEEKPNRATSLAWVQVENTTVLVGKLAARFFGEPSAFMKVIGVTGTNGKTTIATLLYKLFTSRGYTCGLISTVENKIGEISIPSTHTTPDPIALQSLLSEMKQAGCTHVFMEVSSHAIHQHRIAGLAFAGVSLVILPMIIWIITKHLKPIWKSRNHSLIIWMLMLLQSATPMTSVVK